MHMSICVFPCMCLRVSAAQTESSQLPSCDCDQQQPMNHIVDMCQVTKSEAGLKLLHETDDDAVIWLESTSTTALMK